MEKSKTKDRTVLVAIIGTIGVIVAALIAKIDVFFKPTSIEKTEERKLTEEKKVSTQSEITHPSLVPKPIDSKIIEQQLDLKSFQVCFEKNENGDQLKNFDVKYEGYNLHSKTDKNGCTSIPIEIINKEKSISSYTIRATLSNQSTISEEIEIGLTQPSTYKINFKR